MPFLGKPQVKGKKSSIFKSENFILCQGKTDILKKRSGKIDVIPPVIGGRNVSGHCKM